MDDMQAQIKTTLAADNMMARMWTNDSAVWQIVHGGPTPRTRSAADYLYEQINLSNSDMSLKHIAGGLLDNLLELLGMSGLDKVVR
jgi:hypothetical protein